MEAPVEEVQSRSVWERLRLRRAKAPKATIDVVHAPPLSPLAPVDFSDSNQVSCVLEIAARIGEILITAGCTNSDASDQAKAVTESFGLWNVHVDMTASRIKLFSNAGGDPSNPVVHVRVIKPSAQNFDRLSQADKLIRDIRAGRADIAEAQRRLDHIQYSPVPFGLMQVSLSWGVLGGAVAVLLGGGVAVTIISAFAATIIILLSEALGRAGLPIFFQNTVGGIFASFLATVSYHVADYYGVQLRPSTIIATSIIAMLAGLTLVQAIQNGVTAAPITANARFFDTVIITGGVVAGVGIGVILASKIGLALPPLETISPPNFASLSMRVAGSVFATCGFARACYANWSAVGISALTAFFGSSLYYFILIPAGVDHITSTAILATMIGLLGGLLARRFQVPPLIVAIAGVTPMLPGGTIYRGMYGLLHDQLLVGFSNMVFAFATATALSAGVVFGEWIARRLRRPRGLSQYKKALKRLAKLQRVNPWV